MRSNGEMNVTRRRRRAAGASRTTGPHREGRSRCQMDRSRRATRASRAARLYRQDGSGREVAQYRGAARASRAARTDSPRRGIASLPRSLFPAEPARLDAPDLGTVSRDDEVVPVRPSSSRASDRAGSQQTPPWREMDSNPRSPVQNLVNLLYREEEREMLPLCAAEGIGVIPWSPQARGKLSRDWDYTSMRTETDEAITRLFAKTEEADKKVVDRVAEVANARGIPRAQVALAWLLAKPVITAPIVGATKLHHLDDALASVGVKLTAEEIAALEEPYVPHPVVGFV